MKANINVPNELNEITLKQYQRFLKAQDKAKDNNLTKQRIITLYRLK